MKQLALLALMLIAAEARAQGTSTGASFMKNPVDARTAALGEASLADPGAAGSFILNPANLLSNATQVSFSHAAWIQDIRTEHLSLSSPFPYGSFGVSVHTTGIGGIEVRDVPGPPIGTFTARGTAFQAMVALPLMNEFAVGLGVKYLYEKVYVDEHTGYGVDAGVTYRTPVDGLTAAAAVTNIGSMKAVRVSGADLPRLVSVGAAYAAQAAGLDMTGYAAFAAGADPNPSHLRLGLDVGYQQIASARVGYQSGYDARGLSFGLGLRYSLFSLEYAWVPFSDDLGSASLFSIGLRFE